MNTTADTSRPVWAVLSSSWSAIRELVSETTRPSSPAGAHPVAREQAGGLNWALTLLGWERLDEAADMMSLLAAHRIPRVRSRPLRCATRASVAGSSGHALTPVR